MTDEKETSGDRIEQSDLLEPTIYESSYEDHIIAECPLCLDAMHLGSSWRDLILNHGHDVPECPDCETEGGDSWAEDADPKMDNYELLAFQGDKIRPKEGDA